MREKGFTLIELILYIAIVTIVVSALIPFAWNVIEGGAKSSTEQEVYSNARFIAEKIKYEIRNANSINSVTATQLSLNTPTATIINYDSINQRVTIAPNGGATVNLNSNDVKVISFTFTNYTSGDNKTKNVQFNFTIQSNLPQVRQEYKQTVAVEGSAEVRTN